MSDRVYLSEAVLASVLPQAPAGRDLRFDPIFAEIIEAVRGDTGGQNKPNWRKVAERSLDAPDMAAVRAGVQRVLSAFDPYPCVVVDRGWWIVQANPGAAVLLDGVAPHLLERPNALRIALHPDGLAPRIGNLTQWRTHLIERLRREVAASDSDQLSALLTEIDSYPGGFERTQDLGGVAVPLELVAPDGRELRFLSMVTTFGTALDLTAAELSIEAFLPADDATAAALR